MGVLVNVCARECNLLTYTWQNFASKSCVYTLLADVVVAVHLAFIVFVTFGAALMLRWQKVVWLHVPALIWGALTEFLGLVCPLTPLENHFRQLGAGESYQGDFIAHYVLPVIYPVGLTQQTQWLLGAGLLLINVVIYAYVWRKLRVSDS